MMIHRQYSSWFDGRYRYTLRCGILLPELEGKNRRDGFQSSWTSDEMVLWIDVNPTYWNVLTECPISDECEVLPVDTGCSDEERLITKGDSGKTYTLDGGVNIWNEDEEE